MGDEWAPEPVKVYANTYVMDPDPEKRFKPSKYEAFVKELLTKELGEKTYDHDQSKEWSMALCDTIKENIKETTNPRYKIAVQIHIGAMEGQGMFASSRCLWNKNVDNYVSCSYYNNSLYAVAVVFACYYE